MKDQLYVYDCLTGKLRVSNGDFMAVGAGKQNTFRIKAEADNAGVFAQRNGICKFFPHNQITDYSVNGNRSNGIALIKPERFYLFVLSGGCFVAWYGDEDSRPDFATFDADSWYIYNPGTGEWSEEMDFCSLLKQCKKYDDSMLATFYGIDRNAFRATDLAEVADFLMKKEGEKIKGPAASKLKSTGYCCAFCYHQFSSEQAKAIATHSLLQGDPILGERCMKRYIPTEYTTDGKPIDEMGSVSHEYACPVCHHKLPPFYERTKHHRIAIVGSATAGKTYYMTALVQQLERELPRYFGIPFRDADPEQNAALNNMRIRVFYSNTPQEFNEGHKLLAPRLRSTVWHQDEYADMPRPFIYAFNRDSASHTLVLYHTNASCDGKDDKNILQHAESIFYLLDPTQEPALAEIIKESHPEVSTFCTRHICKQSLILTDIEIHLRKTLNLPPGTKTDKPLAIIIAKSDLWQDLLGPEPLHPIVRNNTLKHNNIKANSNRLRDFLFRLTPEICTSAESISDKVSYFAVSSFGTIPEEIEDELTGTSYIAPIGGKLTPAHVTDPVLWALSQCDESLLSDD